MKSMRKFSMVLMLSLWVLGLIGCQHDVPLDQIATPTFTVASGAVDSGTAVEINCGTEDVTIYYTTDGSKPTSENKKYTGAISITYDMTLTAIAVKDGMGDSELVSADYTVKGITATPSFSLTAVSVSGIEVAITCATENASIYYTTDGTNPTTSSTKYTSAISITSTVTLKAIAVKDRLTNSATASVTYTIKSDSSKGSDSSSGTTPSSDTTPVLPTVATPAFSIAAREVASGTTVEITCATSGATIYYTTDGTDPTTSSSVYSSAISINSAMTLKAIAVKDGMNNSAIASAEYKIMGIVDTPTFSKVSGEVASGTTVEIICATEGASIYYTIDGTDPTVSSAKYESAISITSTVTLKAIAVMDGMVNSEVVTAEFTVTGTVAKPKFSVDSGAIAFGTTVEITCATSGATIYYTTDGTDPTTSSSNYSVPISVDRAMTIKAIAVKDGMTNSAIASATYTKAVVATPTFSVTGIVGKNTSVTISCATSGASIYYTTDGTTPTTSSQLYTSITVSSDQTIKAVAVKSGMTDSAIETVKYTILPDGFVKVNGGKLYGSESNRCWSDSTYSGAFVQGRNVKLSDFMMCNHEVTNEEYKTVMSDTTLNTAGITSEPSYSKNCPSIYVLETGEDENKRPVENVTWYDAVYYCNLLSQREGLTPVYTITNITTNNETLDPAGADGTETVTVTHISNATVSVSMSKNGYRLPTEAEWEYAARGGSESAQWRFEYAGADSTATTAPKLDSALDVVGWYYYNICNKGTSVKNFPVSGNKGYGTHEVCKKSANALGIYDMSGNVYEWCYDGDGTLYRGEYVNPTYPNEAAVVASKKVCRGGGWCSKAMETCVGYRNKNEKPADSNGLIGFRVVRSAW